VAALPAGEAPRRFPALPIMKHGFGRILCASEGQTLENAQEKSCGRGVNERRCQRRALARKNEARSWKSGGKATW
jgi:hypothetical protein